MIFLRHPPHQDALSSEYAWEHTAPRERRKRREKQRLRYLISDALKWPKRVLRRGVRPEVKLINRLRPGGGRLLDVGCGGGGTLRQCATHPRWQLFGIEPSPGLADAANRICQPTGGRVVQGTAIECLQAFADDPLDVVIMRSYLEHEVHVAPVLAAAAEAMRPDAILLIKVPNAACLNARLFGPRWPGVRHPDHVNYFQPRHLRTVLKQAGLGAIQQPPHWRSPLSDNMWLVARHGR